MVLIKTDMTREEEITIAAFKCFEEEESSAVTAILVVGFARGAEWAEKTMINKACEWLYGHLYTRRDEQSPTDHFVCSAQEMLTQTEFVEQFRKAMKGE